MRTALVLDGEQRAALAVVRSLGQAGMRVHVGSARRRTLSSSSRHCAGVELLPDPLARADVFVDAVHGAAERLGADLLIPMVDASLLAILPERARFRACIPFVDAETYARVADKDLVLRMAGEVGIAVPAQLRIESADDPTLSDLRGIPFPAVAKPARSVVTRDGVRVKLGVAHVDSPKRLETFLRSLPAEAFPVLIQQRVVGPGAGVFLLLWDDELLAAFAHRRLREKPPSGGVSVYRESIPLDAPLLELSRALLRRFQWRGVAMVEYKVDSATGTPYLMEVNGRFWGSLQLAIDAGVDFPLLLTQAALGERPKPVLTYRPGVRSRWWWGDVDHLLARMRRSAEALSLPPDAPSRSRAILDFLKVWRSGDRNETLRLSDPGPFVRETLDWFRGM